jgi:26S proteasome regulatory subunit N9
VCCVGQPALVAMANTVKEKVALVCTMELASQRSAAERSITFTELAGATRLPLEQIEWLLMRAMSLGLIRGSIDEVDQIIHISYIKVRCFLQLDLTRSYL